jgi:hypothetical protein
VNVEFPATFIEVMKSRFHRSQDVIRIKTYHIMQETSKFIYFALDLDIWPGVLLEERVVLLYLVLKLL